MYLSTEFSPKPCRCYRDRGMCRTQTLLVYTRAPRTPIFPPMSDTVFLTAHWWNRFRYLNGDISQYILSPHHKKAPPKRRASAQFSEHDSSRSFFKLFKFNSNCAQPLYWILSRMKPNGLLALIWWMIRKMEISLVNCVTLDATAEMLRKSIRCQRTVWICIQMVHVLECNVLKCKHGGPR